MSKGSSLACTQLASCLTYGLRLLQRGPCRVKRPARVSEASESESRKRNGQTCSKLSTFVPPPERVATMVLLCEAQPDELAAAFDPRIARILFPNSAQPVSTSSSARPAASSSLLLTAGSPTPSTQLSLRIAASAQPVRNLFPGLVLRGLVSSTIIQPQAQEAAVLRGQQSLRSHGTVIAAEDGVSAMSTSGVVQRIGWVAKLDGRISPRTGCMVTPQPPADGVRSSRRRSKRSFRVGREHCIVSEAVGKQDRDSAAKHKGEEQEKEEAKPLDTACHAGTEHASLDAVKASHDDWWAWYEKEKRRKRVEVALEEEEEEKERERAAIQRESDDKAAGEALRVELEHRRHARKMEAQRVEKMVAAQKREAMAAKRSASAWSLAPPRPLLALCSLPLRTAHWHPHPPALPLTH